MSDKIFLMTSQIECLISSSGLEFVSSPRQVTRFTLTSFFDSVSDDPILCPTKSLYDQSDLNVLFLSLGLSLSLHLVKSLDLHSPASLIPSPMRLPVYILYSVRQNLLYDQSDLNVLFLALGLSLSLHLVKSLDLHSPASLIPSPMILYSVRQNLYMTNQI